MDVLVVRELEGGLEERHGFGEPLLAHERSSWGELRARLEALDRRGGLEDLIGLLQFDAERLDRVRFHVARSGTG